MKLEKFKERNNKKIGIVLFTVCCILLIAGVYFYSSFAIYEQNQNFNVINGTVEDPGDLYFAFYVDDIISKTMPAKGSGYILDTEKSSCTNGATPLLNTDSWNIEIDNLTTTHTKCTLYFKSVPLATDYIISLADTTDNLIYDETVDNNLRYIGYATNNYVSFNDQTWRIIGVMNNVDDGTGNKETRLKIIGSEYQLYVLATMFSLNWDYDVSGNYDNDWTSSQLMDLLNNGAYWNRTTGNYYYDNNGTITNGTVDLTSAGLTEEAKTLIDDAVWYLGGAPSANTTVIDFYTLERGTTVYEGRPTTWIGKVGLMYPSEVGAPICSPLLQL